METSLDGARGVLVSIVGSMDMGLDEVEVAAGLVQSAAHPDANIIFGASFDDSMNDEIRVIVIATGFDEGVRPGQIKEQIKKPAAAPERTVEEPVRPAQPAAAAEDENLDDFITKFFGSK
jgi:cell division protein FtsZ